MGLGECLGGERVNSVVYFSPSTALALKGKSSGDDTQELTGTTMTWMIRFEFSKRVCFWVELATKFPPVLVSISIAVFTD